MTLKKSSLVALVGAGSMGRGLFYQLSLTPGLFCSFLADLNINKAAKCALELKCEYRLVNTGEELAQAIEDNILAISEDGSLANQVKSIDVIVEATNSIQAAGLIIEDALLHQKHVVMMNSEADLAFGPYFMSLASQNQVTYTSCDGDQHGVLARLIDEITLWGFDLVVAGNIKGFLDRYSNPTKIIPEADKRNLDYKMATAYTDGSKLSIEMALLANAYNLRPLAPGMQGPQAKNVQEALDLYDLDEIFNSGQPIVDYLLGSEPGGGVFAIGRTDNAYQQSMMKYYKMGKGPYYLFYRPYHLCHIEAMRCILEAVNENKSLLKPNYGFLTNVYTYAKKPLKKGEALDGLGGYTCYGMIENADQKGLPICLAENLIINREIKSDEKILIKDVTIDPNRDDFRLYNRAIL